MASLSGLNPMAEGSPDTDAITGGTLNLTKTSTYIAALAALFVGIDPLFGQAFPDSLKPTAGVKAAIIIAVIGAWSIMIAADLLARAYASAHQSTSSPVMITAPGRLYAKVTTGPDDPDWLVAGIQVTPSDPPKTTVLLAKKGKAAKWVDVDDVEFQNAPSH